MTQTGYENKEDPSSIDPSLSTWEVEIEKIGLPEDKSVYARIDLNGKTVGTLRLPDMEYLRWLREVLSKNLK